MKYIHNIIIIKIYEKQTNDIFDLWCEVIAPKNRINNKNCVFNIYYKSDELRLIND